MREREREIRMGKVLRSGSAHECGFSISTCSLGHLHRSREAQVGGNAVPTVPGSVGYDRAEDNNSKSREPCRISGQDTRTSRRPRGRMPGDIRDGITAPQLFFA